MSEPSVKVRLELRERARCADLSAPLRFLRYEKGDALQLSFSTVWPERQGRGTFRVDGFAGGGFAGQVYRCTVLELEIDGGGAVEGLEPGGVCAVKIMLPASRFAVGFRNVVYALAFQAPFSPQVSRAACRAGLLWQKAARLAAAELFGRADAVADVYASFLDEHLGAWGEIREWVEGRTWRLEPDVALRRRAAWRTLRPADTDSPEYMAKRQFMSRFVSLLHAMGAAELARQYEWWTMKSQPNVLKRAAAGPDPAGGLCAVDFRAGLALLPVLPMSPADVALIWRGLRRGVVAQFDRGDVEQLARYAREHAGAFQGFEGMIEALKREDRAYRRSLPDIWRRGLRMLGDAQLRADVRRGLCEAYRLQGIADDTFARELPGTPSRFALFYALGAVPVLGRMCRRSWGHAGWRRHTRRMLAERGYLLRALRRGAWTRLIEWHRKGRTGNLRTRRLAGRPLRFWAERLTLGWLPAGMHRLVTNPRHAWRRLSDGWLFMRRFYSDGGFREAWLRAQVEDGHREGMLDAEERDGILARISDPYIAKYLKCLAVHFCTLPVTQVVSVLVGSVAAAWILAGGGSWERAAGVFALWLVFFQVIPISPGSLCRGAYVVYVMVRERNFRDYMVAAPVSFLKYVGYLSFPLQMVTTYPALSRFMASRWAMGAVNVIPVFGEHGALLEHMVFDLFFNVPRALGGWMRPRIRGVLDVWMGLGLAAWAVFTASGVTQSVKARVNLALAVIALCVLPRVLFYPLLRRRGARNAAGGHRDATPG